MSDINVVVGYGYGAGDKINFVALTPKSNIAPKSRSSQKIIRRQSSTESPLQIKVFFCASLEQKSYAEIHLATVLPFRGHAIRYTKCRHCLLHCSIPLKTSHIQLYYFFCISLISDDLLPLSCKFSIHNTPCEG